MYAIPLNHQPHIPMLIQHNYVRHTSKPSLPHAYAESAQLCVYFVIGGDTPKQNFNELLNASINPNKVCFSTILPLRRHHNS